MMKRKMLEAHMRAAEVYAELSHAKRRRVGAVIVKNDSIIGIGYNGTPPGWDNRCEDAHGFTVPDVIHAEQNALDKVIRGGQSSEGAYLFVTCAPCLECAKRVAGAGIRAVYYRDSYRVEDGLDHLRRRGVAAHRIEGGRAPDYPLGAV